MTNRTWIDNADQRENLRDRLNLVINDPCEYSYEEMGLARDSLCVLDSYETLRAERLNALAARERLQSEIETLRAQRDRLRVALAFYADVRSLERTQVLVDEESVVEASLYFQRDPRTPFALRITGMDETRARRSIEKRHAWM